MRAASRVSLLFIAVGLLAVAVVPGLRAVIDEAIGAPAPEMDFLAEAGARQGDGSAWLAAMAFRPPWGEGGEEFQRLDEACAKAAALMPDSAAPCLVRGLSGVAPAAGPEGSERRRRLWAMLDRAEKAEPENAAVDYYRAYLALGEGDQEKVVGALQSALGKEGWDLHEREAAVAGYRLAKERRPEPLAFESVMAVSSRTGNTLTALARTVVERADAAEQRGDHAQAILLRESMLHLGRLMMEHGSSMLEGLSGQIVWRTAATSEDGRSTPEAMAAYLAHHGGAALGQKMMADKGPAERMLAAIQRRNLELGREHEREESAAAPVRRALDALVATVGLIVVLSLLGFVVGLAGGKTEPVRLSAWGWGGLTVACVVAGAAAGVAAPKGFLLVGLPFTAVATAVGVLVGRRRSTETVGAAGQYVGTLIAVLLPMAALATVVVLGLATRVAVERKAEAKVHAAIVERGELTYYKLRLSEQ